MSPLEPTRLLEPLDDQAWMRMALRQADFAREAGEVPIGCVVVKDGRVLAKGYNQVEMLRDPTAHAEILAIGAASSALENWRLDGCSLYVTMEPCPMCAGAVLNSRISRVVYGTADRRLGACGTTMDVLRGNPLNREVDVMGGVLDADCLAIVQDFFRELRLREKPRP